MLVERDDGPSLLTARGDGLKVLGLPVMMLLVLSD